MSQADGPRPVKRWRGLSLIVITAIVTSLVWSHFVFWASPDDNPASEAKSTSEKAASDTAFYNEPGMKLYCPTPGSRAAKKASQSQDVSAPYTGNILVMGERPIVRIYGEGSVSGSIQICGPSATLVIEKTDVLGVSTWMEGKDAQIVLKNLYLAPGVSDALNHVRINQKVAQPTFCYEQQPRHEDISPCMDYF